MQTSAANQSASLITENIRAAFNKACRMDVIAFKPGNVSLCSAGHRMVAADFFASADKAVPALVTPGQPVGERILRAVQLTWDAVGTNTNLGIVLLLAPLAAAAEQMGDGSDLRAILHTVLACLDVNDAINCYAAIRLAKPAGLGQSNQHDVAAAPRVSLLECMRAGAGSDTLAAQYDNNFSAVFEVGLPALKQAQRQWGSLAWATTASYLMLLAQFPDSHIQRKFGSARATAVSAQAGALAKEFKACENPRSLVGQLKAFDHELKSGGVNPGTSADLVVATVATQVLEWRLN